MIVELPDGTRVQATGLGRPEGDAEPDYALYLAPEWQVAWPSTVVAWPDFGLPEDPAACDAAIVDAFERARSGRRVEVGCLGGTGRTGTVLACMAVLAGVDAREAVAWVRAHYRRSAVETADQERYVLEFATRQPGGPPRQGAAPT